MKKFISLAIAIILVASVICNATAVTVKEGYRGIVLKWGKAQTEVLSPGFYITAPWTSVKQMCVQWQRYEITASAYSKDIQQVEVFLSMSYQLSPDSVLFMYRTIGTKYADQIMLPRALDAIKAVFARYSAEDLISKRQYISSEIFTLIHEQMEGYGVNVKEIALENIDFTDSFEAAVEQKQVATQTALRVKIEEQQETAKAEERAKREKIQAEAAAEVMRINAQAEADAIKISADAEAYRLEQESKYITDGILQKQKIEKWDGKLPTITGGAGQMLMDVGDLTGATNE